MRRLLVLALLGWVLSACKGSSPGTYVVLDFQGTVSPAAPMASLSVELEMGNEKAGAVFPAVGRAGISLPTDATLRIGHGSGDLKISAMAKSADGQILGTGSGQGIVLAGQTQHIEVRFGGTPDAGAFTDSDAPPDLTKSPEAGQPVQDGGAGGRDGRWQDGPSAGGSGGTGAGASTGTTGAVTAMDAGALGGPIQDADAGAADSPTGGSLGDAGGLGGAAGQGGSGGAGESATGVTNIISEPSSLLFATVVPGQPGDVLTTVIRNTGSAAGPALAIEVSPVGGPFSISRDNCTGRILGPGTTCSLSVAFNPSTTGELTGKLSVKAGSVSGTDISLKGTGGENSPPELNLLPTQGDFAQIMVGARGSVVFTLSNVGAAPATNLLVSSTGGPGFQMGNDQCSGRALQPGISCTFTVLFVPSTPGPVNGTVAVKSPELSAPLVAGLAGTGKVAGVTLTVNLQGNGNGVVSAPGLTCQGTVCTGQYDPGADGVSVTLTAQPDRYSSFAGWSGGPCNDVAVTCTFHLNGPIATTAKFTAATAQVGLTVLSLQGHAGTITSSDGKLTCSGQCPPVAHPKTARLTLVATPAAGNTFVGWTEGPCQGANPTCDLPLSGDVSVAGTFGPQAYMFVTSTTVVPGRLGGLAGADAECTARAQAAGLPGTYRAWLSSGSINAKSRVGSGGWVRVDGRPFARSLATLAIPGNQIVYYPPRIDEFGRDAAAGEDLVLTGSSVDGTSFGGQCGDYTSTTGPIAVGKVITGSGFWGYTQLIANGCANSYRLYCFNTSAAGDIRPSPGPGKRLFISQNGWMPFGGISNADAFCRTDAVAANLPNANTFVALVAASSTAASGRLIAGTGPWKRVDDVVVFRSPSEMASNTLLATPALQADGTYGDFVFWSGASGPGQTGLRTTSCQDWSSSASTDYGMIGNATLSATAEWFTVPGRGSSCDSIGQRLLCVEP